MLYQPKSAFTPLAYRPKDAAIVLGVSRSRLYQMIADGDLRASKLSGATLIRHDEIERVLSAAVQIEPRMKPHHNPRGEAVR